MEFTETGKTVYDRTYSRTKRDGTKETWPETVQRVVDGNLGLVDNRHQLDNEREDLIRLITEFKIIPGGRHLWASGVQGRQYLFNCHVSGWGEKIHEHFEFTFLRLMEGGGVGANYSNKYLEDYPDIHGEYDVHIVCDPEHPDYDKLLAAGVLSTEFVGDWSGAFEVEDSREGWASALVDLFDAYYRGAVHPNRVFDISRVRAEGSRLKTFGGRASGPLPLARMLHNVSKVLNKAWDDTGYLTGMDAMEIDHWIAECVVSGGNRRSARMSIMHWADEQIDSFLECKQIPGLHWTTNISVEVDELFWNEHHPAKLGAQPVLRRIALGMLKNGEPGFWNSSLSNVGEPNQVTATNPCGEIPLEPFENCNLGHVNLAAFVNEQGAFDAEGLELAHRLMTRFLIRATFGDVNDPKQAAVLARNRRIGVGHLGVASALAMAGVRYSEASRTNFPDLLQDMGNVVAQEASLYSHWLRIPVPVKLTTVAPTGTIAKMPGVSEGIHPIFSRYFIRRIRFSNVDPDQVAQVEKYRAEGYTVEPCLYAPETTVVAIPTKDSLLEEVERRYGVDQAAEIVESADDLELEEMLAFQQMYQRYWADNAVSYTVNISPDHYATSGLVKALQEYGPTLKGVTVFPEMSMPQSPYERLTQKEYEAYYKHEVSDGVDEFCQSGVCPIR